MVCRAQEDPFFTIRVRVHQVCNLLINAIKWDGEISRTRIKFSKSGASNGGKVIFRKTGIHELVEGSNYRLPDRLFPFVKVFIDWCTKYEKTAPKARGMRATVRLLLMSWRICGSEY